MKSEHDREDLIELPEFINLPSDQGRLEKEDEIAQLHIEELPDGLTASEKPAADETAQEVISDVKVPEVLVRCCL